MIQSKLFQAEFNGCVITTFQNTGDTKKQNGKCFREVDSSTKEKQNPPLYHNATKTECDGRWSCSGVILNRQLGIVLCHGSIFLPFLKQRTQCVSWTDRDVLLADEFQEDLVIQVECSVGPRATAKTEGSFNNESLDGRPGLGLIPMSNKTIPKMGQKQLEGQLLMLVACPEFQKAFSHLYSKTEGWVFSSEEEKKEYGELQKDLAYLQWFAVLKMPGPLAKIHDNVRFTHASKLLKGSTVYACGSPFGSFYPDIFLNAISKGVLSNVSGDQNVVLLTDARCLPGSEGGGIYSVEQGILCLVGIIVAPLCWKSNEWVGLTLACSVSHILHNIIKTFGKTGMSFQSDLKPLIPMENCVTDLKTNPGPAAGLAASVVLVDSGPVWGSGVLLNENIVLTCRHVIRGASKVTVKIRSSTNEKYRAIKAQVVFSSEEASPYDIAIVELEEFFTENPQPVLASGCCVGEDVLIIGYGAFGERSGPSVTSGILSGIISVGDTPVMLQTTCAVHGGSSGGPLFTAQSGELLGIVASNTRDNSTGATYPHLNFCIPVSVFQDALHKYTEHGDLRAFQELNKASHSVRNAWRLQRKPERSIPSKL
ncbi:peroxisomal leader peptide-processing protease [Spea bombifrons]|uniref:peroxisomal leader peptide-processing protease n=1 Tax=Spea bombifrons TaxID=233779 RepID=UPI00234B83B6|nr:peroxisomal leader peptide-processing protease [Spea bombifrons]